MLRLVRAYTWNLSWNFNFITDGPADHTPGVSARREHCLTCGCEPASRSLSNGRPSSVWSPPNGAGQGTGLPKLVSFLPQHWLANKRSAWPLWRIHKSYHPRSMSYSSPIFCKNWEKLGRRRAALCSQLKWWLSHLSQTTAVTLLYSQRKSILHPLTPTPHESSSIRKQMGTILHDVSWVDLYPQINNGKKIPSMKLQAMEDLQKLNPDTVLNWSFYI